MEGYPWEDGRLSADEFTELLKNEEHKAVFFELPDREQAEILKESADYNGDVEDTLDKLAKYLKSRFFRSIALGKAAGYGLSGEEADELARVWRERHELLRDDDD
jgi:hypothetical protein